MKRFHYHGIDEADPKQVTPPLDDDKDAISLREYIDHKDEYVDDHKDDISSPADDTEYTELEESFEEGEIEENHEAAIKDETKPVVRGWMFPSEGSEEPDIEDTNPDVDPNKFLGSVEEEEAEEEANKHASNQLQPEMSETFIYDYLQGFNKKDKDQESIMHLLKKLMPLLAKRYYITQNDSGNNENNKQPFDGTAVKTLKTKEYGTNPVPYSFSSYDMTPRVSAWDYTDVADEGEEKPGAKLNIPPWYLHRPPVVEFRALDVEQSREQDGGFP